MLRLRLDNCEILCASNWGELLDEFADRHPDVILLDWELPGCAPQQGLRRLQSEYPGCQVIILGAQREPEMSEAVFISSFDSPEYLVGEVQRLFSKTNLSN
jgi:DNA-binding response OmpR family regulator